MMPYERLDAWRLCHELTLATYHVTAHFPDDERYGLTAQARRAAFSAGANIVEGSAKHGVREYRRFLDIAVGSLSELSYIFRLSIDLGYLSRDEAARIAELRERAAIVTWKLYRSLGTRPEKPAP